MNQSSTSLVSTILITSTCAPEFIDITERVLEIVQETHIRNGLVCVFSKHTTAAIKLNENEYEERQLEFFKPDWKNNLIGLHTFNYEKGCTVIDTRMKRNRFS